MREEGWRNRRASVSRSDFIDLDRAHRSLNPLISIADIVSTGIERTNFNKAMPSAGSCACNNFAASFDVAVHPNAIADFRFAISGDQRMFFEQLSTE